MKPHSFKKVKFEEIAHLSEPINTLSRLNNWQIFALALPAEPAAIIYIVASFPLTPEKCAYTSQKMPCLQRKRFPYPGSHRLPRATEPER